ncbi:MAG TPA: non-heme iron oxygenase ferredoxin subunit [Thermomicrobiaceae bacterium]|nr:non-heme iron oxygenase ferredoxin subunit [Thermomicrobiaceae bacterium]
MSVPEGYVAVMAADEVEEELIYPFVVDEEDRVLTRVEGEIYALEGICTHEYAELSDGEVEDGTLWCPLHGSGFDVQSGKVTNLPATVPLKTYDVQVIDGTIYVAREPKSGPEE